MTAMNLKTFIKPLLLDFGKELSLYVSDALRKPVLIEAILAVGADKDELTECIEAINEREKREQLELERQREQEKLELEREKRAERELERQHELEMKRLDLDLAAERLRSAKVNRVQGQRDDSKLKFVLGGSSEKVSCVKLSGLGKGAEVHSSKGRDEARYFGELSDEAGYN